MTDNKKNTPKGGKQASISAIRFLAMCSIIACHFCQYYGSEWAWWLNVGVQIFLIVSGCLYGSKTMDSPIDWINKQFTKILIPYYIFLIFAVGAYFLFCPEILSLRKIFGALLTIDTLEGLGHLWYIPNILFCYLITPYLYILRDYLSGKTLFKISLYLLGLLAILTAIGTYLHSFIRPGIVSCYIVGFFIPLYLSKNTIVKKTGWLISIFIYAIISTLMVYGFSISSISDYRHMFLGLTVFLILFNLLDNMNYSIVLKISDKISYEMYLVHHMFILSPISILNTFDIRIANVILAVGCTIVTAFMLNYMSALLRNKITI